VQTPNSLDAHAHLDPSRTNEEPLEAGAVLAMSLSLEEAVETRQAVELGCYFSVHSAVARRSLFRTQVPPDRLLVESDHGWADPPGAIPHQVTWVEYLLSGSLGIDVSEIRYLVWWNFSEIVRLTGTWERLPQDLANLLP
jgi:TatD DNase family protein